MFPQFIVWKQFTWESCGTEHRHRIFENIWKTPNVNLSTISKYQLAARTRFDLTENIREGYEWEAKNALNRCMQLSEIWYDLFCFQFVLFARNYNATPTVLLTANHSTTASGNSAPVHNGITTWIEVRFCFRSIDYLRTTKLLIDYHDEKEHKETFSLDVFFV